MMKNLCKIKIKDIGLRIANNENKTATDFLNVTFDLLKKDYKPCFKQLTGPHCIYIVYTWKLEKSRILLIVPPIR